MTQFRLYDSPQSFVYDSPQSFLHGVTQEEVCYALLRSDGARLNPPAGGGSIGIGDAISIPPCLTISDPNVIPSLGNANARMGVAVPDYQAEKVCSTGWLYAADIGGSSFFTPAEIKIGNVLGVESGAAHILGDLSRNTVLGAATPSCFFFNTSPVSLPTTLDGTVEFQRAEWMIIETFAAPSGNAPAGAVKTLNYVEAFYTETDTTLFSDVDWAAAGYFLPGEPCYFEGCPPPYYPTPYTSQINFQDGIENTFSGPLEWFHCDGTVWPGASIPPGAWSSFATNSFNGFDLTGNMAAFSWEDVLIVLDDGSGQSFAWPPCPVGSTLNGSPGFGFDGYAWTGQPFAGQPQAAYNGNNYVIQGRKLVSSGFLGRGLVDCYLWFPGAPTA